VKTIFLTILVLFGIGNAPFVYAGVITGKVQVPGKNSIENIVVYVEGVNGNFQSPKKRPDMNHINLQFKPGTLAVIQGTTVDFPNSDPVFHSAFSISKTTPFDLGIYGQGREKFVHFQNSGLVEIFCHIHSHMHAFVLVLENTLFAATSEDGSFTIRDVPEGTYRVKAWMNPSLYETRSITINGNESVSLNFTLTSEN
jgi:plastocyanin